MRPLVIEREPIDKLIAHAQTHRIDLDALKAIYAGQMPPAGDYAARTIELPIGYRIVFTIEEHPQEGGTTKWFKHLSISCDNKMPHPAAAEMIAKEFDMEMSIVYPERNPVIESINILELL